ncbi:MAG: ABC transporter ATP-binding protein [Planctomycetes bacterium]|nr:ABC transporter ATP-binding protein [Planctomycetota bacterium]
MRYTNARSHVMGRACGYIKDAIDFHKPEEEHGKEKGKAHEKPRLAKDQGEHKFCLKCNFPLGQGSKVCPVCLNKGRVLLRIMSYVKPYKFQMVMVWILLLSTTFLNLIPPYLTIPLLDKVLIPVSPMPLDERLAMLAFLVAGLAGAQALNLLVTILRGRILARLGTRVVHDMRTQVFTNLQMHSLGFFDRQKTGDIMSRVSQDTQNLEGVLIEGVQFIVVDLLTLVGIGTVLFSMNWQLTVYSLLPVPLVLVLTRFVWTRIIRLFMRAWLKRGRMNAVLNDSLSGIRVVKAFAREKGEIERFSKSSKSLRDAMAKAEQAHTSLFPTLGFLTSSGIFVVWYCGGRQVIGGELTIGTMMAFIAYLNMFYAPLQFISRITDWLARSLAAAQRVFEILDEQPEIYDIKKPKPMARMKGEVSFRGITFGYDPYKPVLQDISLEVKPGEMIGLVGHSGAGKSTCINLLCRFYDPQKGNLLIDGIDIRDIAQHDLRSQLGVVLQETFLFDGTIAENIAYAKPDASQLEIMNAAKAANAHDFILGKNDGYDTLVGERGQSLSGGERQRIAIARAILHDPRVLILDEATSSVDTDTEKKIQEAIQRLIKGRTTFAIAHRLSTLKNADRLVVLKDGKIIESGTHEELLSAKGEFHRLVSIQQETSAIQAIQG